MKKNSQKRKYTFIGLLGTFFGVLFALSFFLALSKGNILASLGYAIASVVLTPQIYRMISDYSNIELTRGMRIFIGLIGIIIACYTFW